MSDTVSGAPGGRDPFSFVLDGREIEARRGETILQAADRAGLYIPRLCAMNGLEPFGACRVCTVLVNGRPQSACTQPATPGVVVESNTESLGAMRRRIVEMLFVEGNHYCMFCEKSGNCELQAMGYRLGLLAPELPYQFPKRELDATHPDVMIDRNRCILCGRCVLASRDQDGKHVFGFVGRGAERKIAVNAAGPLGATELAMTDKAAEVCPVGAIVKKRQGYRVPVGKRKFDKNPIGQEIEERRSEKGVTA
jgi:[NiFe] hydrogenase diaphorase moiety small subunit